MKRKKSSGGGGANWRDTYGDMVTLLLCFFVLLYSMSSVDENKWMALVKSFNPNAIPKYEEDSGDKGPADEANNEGLGLVEDQVAATQEEIDAEIEALYQALQRYAQESQSGQSIETTKGDGYVFISFDDTVFFDGESYEIKPAGQQVLTDISNIFSQAAPYIDEVRIMGHTAQASMSQPNNPTVDRFLASNRSAIATVFIQDHCTLDPGRILSVGYGQHRSIASNETPEGRSRNRRVEIIITGRDASNGLSDSIQQYYSLRAGEGSLDGQVTQQ